MKDIAEDLGLSVVTVSKVLRNHPDIGESTRERVLRRVKELNYEPNILARSLVTGRSFLVGLVVPDLLHPFFAEVAKALSSTIRSKGYSLIISSSEESASMETLEIRHLRARRLDALVLASTRDTLEPADFPTEKDDILVLIDRDLAGSTGNYVGTDDVAAGRLATEHLADVGCQRIAHIRGRENSTGTRRFEGYRQALAERGLPYTEAHVISRERVDTHSVEEGAAAMRLLLQTEPRPDGVFCYNDPLAIGAMHTILEAGFRIPEDIAVVGCGNLHYDGELRVPLSSIDQHSQQIGEHAGNLVLSMLEAKQKPAPQRFVLKPALVARASTARENAVSQPSGVVPSVQATSAKKPTNKKKSAGSAK